MIRRAHWGLCFLLLAPLGAWALGLGDIELRSALNQPLEADIQLVSATPEELADLSVNLASPETFQRYGLDRPAFLGRLRFNVARDPAGRSVIRVTSVEPITEPFVTVLVEANWARGRLLREYTVLLDPPVLLPQEAVPEPVQPASTRAPQPAQPAAVIQRPPAQQAAAPTPAPAPAQVNAPRLAPAADRPNAYGPVERGETLWGIASRYRPAGVTMNQMMVAIYRANPSAFQGNMNLLRQGARLDLPSDATLSSLSATEATQVAIGETAAWEGRSEQQARLRLLPPEVETAPTQPAAATRPAPAPAPANSPAAAATGGARTTSPAQDDRVLSIEDEALSNLQQLANEPPATEVQPAPAATAPNADANVAAGVDLELDEIFAEEPDEAAAADEQPEPAPAVTPPRPAATTQVVAAPAAPSLVSRIIGWLTAPLLWVAVLLVALVGAAAVYLRSRQSEGEELTGRWEALEEDSDEDTETREVTERLRSQARAHPDSILVEEQHTQELPRADESDEEFFDIGEQEPEPELADEEMLPAMELDVDDEVETKPAPESDTAKLRAAKAKEAADATLSSQTVINLDQADPIAEADFHMAYGLYDQAADLISKALEANPDDRALLLKLLEVYFVWGNREAFLDTANILRAEIGSQPDSDWDKVVIMGKQICPEESLFAGSVAAAAGDAVDLDLAAGDSPALDLAFEDQGDGAVDLDLSGDDDATLQIDSDDTNEQSGIFGRSGSFDIGDQTAAGLEAAFFEKDGQDASAKTSPNLDLDSQTQEAPTMEAIGPDAPTIESPVFDQDIDASAELPTLQQPKLKPEDLEGGDRTAEIDLDDLGLDLDDLSEISETPTGTHNSLLDLDDEESDVLSATGVTQVLSAGDTFGDADKGEEDTGQFTGTEVLAPLGGETDATARYPMTSQSAVDNLRLDIDLDELSAALDGEDTVEQPNVGGYGGNKDVEFDVGFDLADSDEPTAREPITANDAQTMTEVGTKLDLARAYIDMGDPEGARSILEEVLDEGDSSQQKEAQGLIDAL
jgi:pilus assembly protein FimV